MPGCLFGDTGYSDEELVMKMILILFFALAICFFFSFWNGFTDAAYAISTVIGTRTLKPIQAVGMATVGNFIGLIFGSAVALTVGTGIISGSIISGEVIIATLIGALIFDVIVSWIFSMPISETHVLIGGLVGAGLAVGGISVVNIQGIISKVVIPMLLVPVISLFLVFLLTLLIVKFFRKFSANAANRYSRRLQIASSFYFSVTEGTNGAQKTMGIITTLLVYYGLLSAFKVPLWVMIGAYACLSLGTFLGGWRVVKTMATKITKLKPYQGFSAELGSGLILTTTALLGFPVSSTHVSNGAIMGVGLTRGAKSVKWITTRRIVTAWILSMPLAAVFSFTVYKVLTLFL